MGADVEVRAYDLGGFGDIAGALRVASHLQRTGVSVTINPKSESAGQKLTILHPDVPKGKGKPQCIKVDVAGHYRDDRNAPNKEVPHHYTEDMDNPVDRRDTVPLYLKTGLMPLGRQISGEFGGYWNNPMFYRPFREWDLPKPRDRNVKDLILQSMLDGKSPFSASFMGRVFRQRKSALERLLGSSENISFAHFQPGLNPDYFFGHPYMRLMELAAGHWKKSFVTGVFFNQSLEQKVAEEARVRGYSYFRRKDQFIGDKDKPTLLFLGPQPQVRTTSLFLSATMPNLVTGDLSLSDALYGVFAMNGPGFFYDCPEWKIPTLHALMQILHQSDEATCQIMVLGSLNIEVPEEKRKDFLEDLSLVAHVLAEREYSESYRGWLKLAVEHEVTRRFGHNTLLPYSLPLDGFYVPPGAPYLFQDATRAVVAALLERPELFSEIENRRRRLMGDVPVIVVSPGVLADKIPESNGDLQEYLSGFKDLSYHFGKKGKIDLYNYPEESIIIESPYKGISYSPTSKKGITYALCSEDMIESKHYLGKDKHHSGITDLNSYSLQYTSDFHIHSILDDYK